MSDEPSDPDIDFEDQMKQFTSQYEAPSSAKPGEPKGASKSEKADFLLGVGEMVRPLAESLDAIKRAGSDNNTLLTTVAKTVNAQRAVPQAMEAMAEEMKRMGRVESSNEKMFAALHGELKTYKDNFLFDALQKPFIRDLVTLYDDFSAVLFQAEERLNVVREAAPESDECAFLQRIHGNLENNVHHILEVFLRMDVTIVKTPAGAPLDKKIHRTVAVAPAESPADDSLVDRSTKTGFFWHDRTVRPEEVVVRRWTPPAPAPAPVEPESAKETVLIEPVALEKSAPEVEEKK